MHYNGSILKAKAPKVPTASFRHDAGVRRRGLEGRGDSDDDESVAADFPLAGLLKSSAYVYQPASVRTESGQKFLLTQ